MRRGIQTILGGAILCLGVALGSRAAGPTTEVSELKATIREWDVPTKGAHPHDPAVGADGALWFTEQMVSKIGRLDPKTGAFIATEISGSREISRATSASSTRGREP